MGRMRNGGHEQSGNWPLVVLILGTAAAVGYLVGRVWPRPQGRDQCHAGQAQGAAASRFAGYDRLIATVGAAATVLALIGPIAHVAVEVTSLRLPASAPLPPGLSPRSKAVSP